MRKAQDMPNLMSDDLFEPFMKKGRIYFTLAKAEG